MNDSERIIISGFGSIARKHIRIIKEFWPNIQIGVFKKGELLFCDELSLISKKLSSYKDCIEWKPNYIIIASPCSFHLNQALFFAGEGIPTFIEKPIGDGNEQESSWKKLLSISKKVPIMVGYVFRHDDCLKPLQNILSKNNFGKIIEIESYCGSWLPDWRPNSNYKKSVSAQKHLGGGVLLELSHEIDLINYLFGPIEIKYASTQNTNSFDTEVEDIAFIHAECHACNFINLNLNFCTKPAERYLKIRFSNTNITWYLNNQVIKIKGMDGQENIFYKSERNQDYKYKEQFKNFFKLVQNIESNPCSVEEGFESLSLICKAKKSF